MSVNAVYFSQCNKHSVKETNPFIIASFHVKEMKLKRFWTESYPKKISFETSILTNELCVLSNVYYKLFLLALVGVSPFVRINEKSINGGVLMRVHCITILYVSMYHYINHTFTYCN